MSKTRLFNVWNFTLGILAIAKIHRSSYFHNTVQNLSVDYVWRVQQDASVTFRMIAQLLASWKQPSSPPWKALFLFHMYITCGGPQWFLRAPHTETDESRGKGLQVESKRKKGKKFEQLSRFRLAQAKCMITYAFIQHISKSSCTLYPINNSDGVGKF